MWVLRIINQAGEETRREIFSTLAAAERRGQQLRSLRWDWSRDKENSWQAAEGPLMTIEEI